MSEIEEANDPVEGNKESSLVATPSGSSSFGQAKFCPVAVLLEHSWSHAELDPSLLRQGKGFLCAWNRALKFYRDNSEVMIPYVQRKFSIKDSKLARRMYENDAPNVILTGRFSPEVAREILDTGREVLRIKEMVPLERVFDFSLAQEAER